MLTDDTGYTFCLWISDKSSSEQRRLVRCTKFSAMARFSDPTKLRCHATPLSLYLTFYQVLLSLVPAIDALHHMKRAPLQYVSQRDETRPLVVSNLCKDTIWPGIVTQSGTSPTVSGFQLTTGQTMNLTVSADWQGRVWGRTNCSFNSAGTGPSSIGGFNGYGQACGTGDCGGIVNCKATVGIEFQRHPSIQKSAEPRSGSYSCDARRVHAGLFQ